MLSLYRTGRKFDIALTATVLYGSPSSFHQVLWLQCFTYPPSFCQIGQLLIFTPYRMDLAKFWEKPDKSGRKFEIALTATVLNRSLSSFHQVSW